MLIPICLFLWIGVQLDTCIADCPKYPACKLEARGIAEVELELREADELDIAIKVARVVAKVAELGTGVPFTKVVDIIEEIVGLSKGGKLSLWDQLETKVQREIRTAIGNYKAVDIRETLKCYTYHLKKFVCRAKTLKEQTTAEKEKLVDDMHKHYESTFKDYNFDFTKYGGLQVYGWDLMDAAVAAVAHQRLILSLLITVCRELPQPNKRERRPEFFQDYLKQLIDEWKPRAQFKGPEFARELYWEPTSTDCKMEALQFLVCTDFENRVFQVSYKHSGACYDFDVGLKTGGRFENPCGTSARRFFLPIAEKIWKRFSFPLLKMFDDPSVKDLKKGEKKTTASEKPCRSVCKNPDDREFGPWCKRSDGVEEECYNTTLPKKYFPSGCVSPCGKWDGYKSWCAKNYNKRTRYGGTYDNC